MIFEDYIKYYTDENIAKNYTIREWWFVLNVNNGFVYHLFRYKCTSKHDESASCYPLFEDFFKAPVLEVHNLIMRYH